MDCIAFLKGQTEKIVKFAVFFSIGVICFLIWHYSTTAIEENPKVLIFESPNYPEMHVGSSVVLKFIADKGFAGIKVHFIEWEADADNSTTNSTEEDDDLTLCEKFSFQIVGLGEQHSEELCGPLKGYTLLLDRKFYSGKKRTLKFHIQLAENNLKCKWKFEVSQIFKEELTSKINFSNSKKRVRRSVIWQNEDNGDDGDIKSWESPLIANGLDTDISNVPWQVSIRDMTKLPVYALDRNCSLSIGRHFCGGSLISSNAILSAAHCFFTSWSECRSLSSLRIIVEDVSTCFTTEMNNQSESSRKYHEIQSVYFHYGLDSSIYKNDIALIKLKTPVVFSKNVMPIQMNKGDTDSYAGEEAYISGWGRTDITSPRSHSNLLKIGKVILKSNEFCTEEYPYISKADKYLTKSILCSQQTFSTSGPGRGDSGGGLYSSQKSTLLGVTSFIVRENNLSYFQSVSFFENWIKLALQF